MSKSKSAKQPKARPVTKSRAKLPTAARFAEGRRPARSNSKRAKVVELLSRPNGTTVAAIMKATGWQQHSVHGFLSGVVRKKLGLALESDKTDGQRVYRIASVKGAKAKPKVENKVDRAA